MAVISEPLTRAAEFVVSEASGYRSREVGVAASAGTDLLPGTVLGKVTASGKLVILAPGASDGSQAAVGILYGPARVTEGDKRVTLIVRDAEVNGLCLIWPSGITGGQQTTANGQLAALGIINRT